MAMKKSLIQLGLVAPVALVAVLSLPAQVFANKNVFYLPSQVFSPVEEYIQGDFFVGMELGTDPQLDLTDLADFDFSNETFFAGKNLVNDGNLIAGIMADIDLKMGSAGIGGYFTHLATEKDGAGLKLGLSVKYERDVVQKEPLVLQPAVAAQAALKAQDAVPAGFATDSPFEYVIGAGVSWKILDGASLTLAINKDMSKEKDTDPSWTTTLGLGFVF
ncbi:MAG: hypothetical protein IPK86_04315 [Neisseriales bacterium]|nr:MAG: hypothetical protein IPK86_04315 [Neisseriales bacterium]